MNEAEAHDPRIDPRPGDIVYFPPAGTWRARHPHGPYEVSSRYSQDSSWGVVQFVTIRTPRGVKQRHNVEMWAAFCKKWCAAVSADAKWLTPQALEANAADALRVENRRLRAALQSLIRGGGAWRAAMDEAEVLLKSERSNKVVE